MGKHYSNGSLPNHTKKGSFWWRDIQNLLDKFKGMASISVANGASCLFWDDCWCEGPLKLAFPELFSFAKKTNISLQLARLAVPSSSLFHLPLSVEAHDQFQVVEGLLQNFDPSTSSDTWYYIWGSPNFTSKKAYRHLLGSSWTAPIFKWIWQSSCEPKHKVFFWLLFQDRLSTRNILRRRNMPLPSYSCVLCSLSSEETVNHLFLECDLAKACWSLIGLTISSEPDPFRRFQSLKLQLRVKFFMEVITIMCRSIWTVRNDVIFRGIEASSLRGLEIFKHTFRRLLWRAKKNYFPEIELSLEQDV